MARAEPQATTLNEFLDHVAGFEKLWSEEEGWLWYRGQEKAYWSLTPKLYRDFRERSRETEDDIREEFIMRAKSDGRKTAEFVGMVFLNAAFRSGYETARLDGRRAHRVVFCGQRQSGVFRCGSLDS